jgi:hypothetical protein
MDSLFMAVYVNSSLEVSSTTRLANRMVLESMFKLGGFCNEINHLGFAPSGFHCVLAFLSSSALPPLPGPETVEPRLNCAGKPKYNVECNPHAFPDSKLLRDAVVEVAEVRLLTLGRLQLLVLCMTRMCGERREESLACMEGDDGRRPCSQR